MGIIKNADKNNTGLQIVNWKTTIMEHIADIETLKSSLKAQFENMKENKIDFIEEDLIEMEELLTEVNTELKRII